MHVRHVHVQISAGSVQVIIMVQCACTGLDLQTLKQRMKAMTCEETPSASELLRGIGPQNNNVIQQLL